MQRIVRSMPQSCGTGSLTGPPCSPPIRRCSHVTPLDLADDLAAPVLGLYGREDEVILVPTVEAMKDRLKEGSSAARASEIIVYDGAGHAFFADYRDSFKAGPAADAWRRCLDWLSERTSA